MGLYTKFYFRAKLRFDTPQVVLDMLHAQFRNWETLKAAGLVNPDDTYNDGVKIQEWEGWEKNSETVHEFFGLKRADRIPWARNGEDFPEPKCITYPDRSTVIEFTAEINYGYNEIIEFCRWIAPYVRMRYAKRQRGRDHNRVWIGWFRSEGEDNRQNLFIKMGPLLPRVEPMRWGQDLDW